MKEAVVAARIIPGLIFTVFSLDYFVPFLPHPEMGSAACTSWEPW